MEKEKEIQVVYTDALYLDVRVPFNGVLYVGTKEFTNESQDNPLLESVS